MSDDATRSRNVTDVLSERAVRPEVLASWLAQVEAALATRGNEPALAWRRAGLLRGLGRLNEAAVAYADLKTDAGNALAALLLGQALEPCGREGPARFLRIPDFLPPNLYRLMWERVTHDASLSPAMVGPGRVDETRRRSFLLEHSDELLPWFPAKIMTAIDRGRVVERLGLSSFEYGTMELQVTRHVDGDFFKPHRDAGNANTASRRLTYVYYFHRTPKRFRGGDLLLCDQKSDGRRVAELGLTRLEPVDNCIVFFAADRLHAVTPVTMESDDPADGRWTVNGWLHEKT